MCIRKIFANFRKNKKIRNQKWAKSIKNLFYLRLLGNRVVLADFFLFLINLSIILSKKRIYNDMFFMNKIT